MTDTPQEINDALAEIPEAVPADDLEFAKQVIKAMAEDGWMFHGEEGMDATQELCYQAYLRFGLKDACFVHRPPGTKVCHTCMGSGRLSTVGDTE